MKVKIDTKVLICVAICLTVIQLYAMHYGIDGIFRSVITGLLALIVGIRIDATKIFKK